MASRTISGYSFAKLFVVFIGLLTGLAIAGIHSLFSLIVGIAFSGVLLCILIVLKGYKLFWGYLIFILLGYQFLGKGFAYLGFSTFGIAPIYMAEIGLFLAIFCMSRKILSKEQCIFGNFLRPEIFFLLLYLIWQLIRTIFYSTIYSIDTFHDAALWGYAFYALFIYLLIPKTAIERFFRFYGRVLPFLLMWLVVSPIIVKLNLIDIRLTGSPVNLFWIRPANAGVHLAGAAVFMLLRLDLYDGGWSQVRIWLLWLVWVVAWIVCAIENRPNKLPN